MKQQPPSALDPIERSPSALEHVAPSPPKDVRGGTAPPTQRRRGWVWIILIALAGVGAYFLWPRLNIKTSGSTSPPAAAAKGGRGPLVTPVDAAKARKGDIGVYFNGLGAVTPIYTVTVKSRVDGQLMSLHYNEGDLVRKGDLLVEIDPRPYQVQLEQAEGLLTRDQANLANAQTDLARYETLLKQNAIPEQQLATQRATVAQIQGSIRSDQGQINAAKLNLVYCQISAPITGRIGLRLVDPGNIVHASDANGLLVITQIQPISVIFTIAEDQLQAVLKRFNAGQRLRVDAYDRGMTQRIAQGTLTTIDNQIDPSTATLKLRATFENKDTALFPNQFVNARLLVEEKHGVTVVPTAGVQRNSQTTYVYLVKPDSSVTVRNVVVGAAEGSDSEIVSGLAAGDVIVMTGVDKLQEGSKVRAHLEGDKTQKGS
jgi:multidrug efflux system membrane fusion protein